MNTDVKKDITAAKKYLMRLLGIKDYSAAELNKKLIHNGFDEYTASDAVEWVKSLGYINDRDYAEKLVRRLMAKCRGRYKIRFELITKGITEDICDSVLCEIEDDEFQDEALRFIRKKYGAPPFSRETRRKITSALIQRGFDYDFAEHCINMENKTGNGFE